MEFAADRNGVSRVDSTKEGKWWKCDQKRLIWWSGFIAMFIARHRFLRTSPSGIFCWNGFKVGCQCHGPQWPGGGRCFGTLATRDNGDWWQTAEEKTWKNIRIYQYGQIWTVKTLNQMFTSLCNNNPPIIISQQKCILDPGSLGPRWLWRSYSTLGLKFLVVINLRWLRHIFVLGSLSSILSFFHVIMSNHVLICMFRFV